MSAVIMSVLLDIKSYLEKQDIDDNQNLLFWLLSANKDSFCSGIQT